MRRTVLRLDWERVIVIICTAHTRLGWIHHYRTSGSIDCWVVFWRWQFQLIRIAWSSRCMLKISLNRWDLSNWVSDWLWYLLLSDRCDERINYVNHALEFFLVRLIESFFNGTNSFLYSGSASSLSDRLSAPRWRHHHLSRGNLYYRSSSFSEVYLLSFVFSYPQDNPVSKLVTILSWCVCAPDIRRSIFLGIRWMKDKYQPNGPG